MPTIEPLVFDAIRTPRGRGKSNGSLHATKPVDLVVGLIHETLARNGKLDPSRVDDVILGCVTPIGDQGGDIAKVAAIKSGLPDTVAGVQLNRFCASGLEAVNTAAQKIASGWEDLIFAGGVESMSRVPMGADGSPWLNDPETNYDTGFVPQGVSADLIATVEGWSREDVDAFAVRSQQRAGRGPGGGVVRTRHRRRHDARPRFQAELVADLGAPDREQRRPVDDSRGVPRVVHMVDGLDPVVALERDGIEAARRRRRSRRSRRRGSRRRTWT